MNASEHYQKAEELTAQAHTVDPDFALYLVAKAQVHATLATIPESQIAIYYATQRRLVERLTEDHCLAAFRDAWHKAEEGDRVRSGMTAAIKAALL